MNEGCGSLSLTNGSGSGYGRPKNIWFLRIRIRIRISNTSFSSAAPPVGGNNPRITVTGPTEEPPAHSPASYVLPSPRVSQLRSAWENTVSVLRSRKNFIRLRLRRPVNPNYGSDASSSSYTNIFAADFVDVTMTFFNTVSVVKYLEGRKEGQEFLHISKRWNPTQFRRLFMLTTFLCALFLQHFQQIRKH